MFCHTCVINWLIDCSWIYLTYRIRVYYKWLFSYTSYYCVAWKKWTSSLSAWMNKLCSSCCCCPCSIDPTTSWEQDSSVSRRALGTGDSPDTTCITTWGSLHGIGCITVDWSCRIGSSCIHTYIHMIMTSMPSSEQHQFSCNT